LAGVFLGVPPVTLGWGDQKYIEVFKAFGVPEFYVDYREASLHVLRQRTNSCPRSGDSWLNGMTEQAKSPCASR
jgi:hypothetical protein